MTVFTSEADIARVPSLQDRRELRNFNRFLRLWPAHGFDMIQRPRWQKYLGLSEQEAAAMVPRPQFPTPAGREP
jgi:hypothetical protein